MQISGFRKIYSQHPKVKQITGNLNSGEPQSKLHIKGLSGSSASVVVCECFQQFAHPTLVLLSDKEESVYFYNDLVSLMGEDKVLFYPSSYKRSMTGIFGQKIDQSGIILRTEVLSRLQSSHNNVIVVSYPGALVEKVVTKNKLAANTLHITVNEHISIEFIIDVLTEYNFKHVDFVFEPGQFAVRGSIVDIFSYASDVPHRIDFFGETVESMRSFDVVTQLSKGTFEQISIIPNIQKIQTGQEIISFLDFIPQNAVIWAQDIKFTVDRVDKIFEDSQKTPAINIDNEEIDPFLYFIKGEEISHKLKDFKILEFGHHSFYKTPYSIVFNISAQPAFQKNFSLLAQNLKEKTDDFYTNIILSDNEKQIERLKSIFESEELHTKITFEPLLIILHEGFIDHDIRYCCYTDHQIFERFHKFNIRGSQITAKEALSLIELNSLKPGDYVVHVDHGIGKFGGLEVLEVNGKKQEAIRLVYKDNDVLFVSIHSLHRISKYKGKDGEAPSMHKLGTGAWQRQKAKTKSRVKDIAKELIALYAQRKAEAGFSFSPDSYLQAELESSFIYEDTPDQVKATYDVKNDMESPTPMDRLICGDVGFGKTEIAIRAAFKAVAESKQVAVLVPTTILALQHYHTFSQRLKNFPCNVDYLCRLKSAKSQKETMDKLKDGKVDIVIGTHRLISSDIKFKDLGLLVIDEEQKFGVGVKEKLKRFKVNVDTLTMTATPIPRTMQFSLMGARDLSIINTPPPNRYPIITEVHPFNEDVIRESINYELARNGQVFFIHNRVHDIIDFETLIKRLCPEARTVIAHGQMEGPHLEKVMIDFINEDYNVLIATTIVENGLDIPNANTIIINDAHKFGLSDLHQLRGRVGRSNKKAFAYLLAPPLTTLPNDSKRRLIAIENFSELGSGFNIALQDLDIRGAGNLLGGEQSGFIADIGFETYQRILDEALLELRENEFKELYAKNEKMDPVTENMLFVNDCHIDTDLELLLPESYIENMSERIKLYRELDNVDNEDKLKEFETRMVDRFGPIPSQSQELFDIVRLRWVALKLGIEKIVLKNNKMLCYLISNPESAFYQTPVWRSILSYLQHNPKGCSMKEGNNKLTITFEAIKSIGHSIRTLEKILN